jgi:hypothetical protein
VPDGLFPMARQVVDLQNKLQLLKLDNKPLIAFASLYASSPRESWSIAGDEKTLLSVVADRLFPVARQVVDLQNKLQLLKLDNEAINERERRRRAIQGSIVADGGSCRRPVAGGSLQIRECPFYRHLARVDGMEPMQTFLVFPTSCEKVETAELAHVFHARFGSPAECPDVLELSSKCVPVLSWLWCCRSGVQGGGAGGKIQTERDAVVHPAALLRSLHRARRGLQRKVTAGILSLHVARGGKGHKHTALQASECSAADS